MTRRSRRFREPVEGVALLALALHEAATNWSCVGPREDGTEILDDLENDRRDISLLTMFASSALSEIDWLIVRALDEHPEELAAIFAEVEFYRREAILHALAAGEGKHWVRVAIPADFALAVGERWEEVEEAMERWRALGLTATRDDVEDVYLKAMAAGTGRSEEEVWDDYLDWDLEAEAKREVAYPWPSS